MFILIQIIVLEVMAMVSVVLSNGMDSAMGWSYPGEGMFPTKLSYLVGS